MVGRSAENWSVLEDRLVLTSTAYGTIHYIEAAVNGPGMMELWPSNFQSWKFEGAIFVDDLQSGGKIDQYKNRIQVGEGSHVIRWQLKNIAASYAQPAIAELHPAKWEQFSEMPLPGAGVSAGAVELTGDWVGQDRWHHGDGSAAWSGIQLFGLPKEPLAEPVMRAEFSGAGVFSYHYMAGGAAGKVRHDGGTWEPMAMVGGWHRVVARVNDGDHRIEWKAASGNSAYRRDRDLLIDEIRFSPEIALADALDTPELDWEGTDKGGGRPFGAEDRLATGGATVIMPNGSSIATQLPGEGIIRIRFKGYKPGVALGTEQLAVEILANDPDVAGTDYRIAAALIPAGGGPLTISTYWQIEVDSVEWVTPPPSIAATLGLPEIITSGGTGNWAPAPVRRLGKYVAALTVTATSPEGWFEFPVTGPAEVKIGYDGSFSRVAIAFLVDEKHV